PAIAGAVLVYLVLPPYVLGAFITPNHAMAPTLLGPHRLGIWPHCGMVATVPADAGNNAAGEADGLGMCESCQQAGTTSKIAPGARSADRFLVNKLLAPQRWDLIAFRSLQDPAVLYVKRLVGLPGEEVVVKDGKIWI